jgi:hypothetical protein
MMLIGKGWQITRPNLLPAEKKSLYTLIVFYGFGWVSYFIVGNDNTSGSFIILLIRFVSYICVLYNVWISTALNIRKMIIQMDLLRAHGIRPMASPSYYKYLMFRSCRNFFLSYLLLTATADVFTIGMHRRSPWIPHLLTELVEMMLIIGFGHTLRQRQYSPYTHMENGDNLPNTNGEGQDELREWEVGSGLPDVNFGSGSARVAPAIVAIANPGQRKSSFMAIKDNAKRDNITQTEKEKEWVVFADANENGYEKATSTDFDPADSSNAAAVAEPSQNKGGFYARAPKPYRRGTICALPSNRDHRRRLSVEYTHFKFQERRKSFTSRYHPPERIKIQSIYDNRLQVQQDMWYRESVNEERETFLAQLKALEEKEIARIERDLLLEEQGLPPEPEVGVLVDAQEQTENGDESATADGVSSNNDSHSLQGGNEVQINIESGGVGDTPAVDVDVDS